MGFVLNLTWEFMKLHPWLFVLDFLFLLTIPLNDLLLPHMYGKIVANLQNDKETKKYMLYVLAILTTALIADGLHDWHDAHVDPNMIFYIREQMVDRVLQKYDGNYNDVTQGDLLSKLLRFPRIVLRWFDSMKNHIVPYTLVFFGMGFYFFMHDKVLGITMILSIILIMALLVASPHGCEGISEKHESLHNRFFNVIEDIFTNMISIYTNDTSQQEIATLNQNTRDYLDAYKGTTLCVLKYKFFTSIVLLVLIVIFFFRIIFLLKNKQLKTAAFVSIFAMLTTTLGNLRWMISMIRDIVFDYGILKSDHDFDFEKPPPPATPDYPPPTDVMGMEHIKYVVGEREILTDTNFNIKKGECLVLTGKIGTGKSTILKILAKLLTPTAGHAYMNNSWYESPATRKIGYVPQVATLFDRSLFANITYGNSKSYTPAEIQKYLEDIGVWKEFAKLPNGLDTVIGKNGSLLSGGQRQLIWCIRVILKEPDVLLLDEPTSSMDETTKSLLIELLRQQLTKLTIIMVSHDPVLIRFASRTLRLS